MASKKMRVTVILLLVAAGLTALGLQACGGNPPAKPEPTSMPVT